MRRIVNNLTRMLGPVVVLAIFGLVPAYGQVGKLQISQLDKFADKASESIDITVDEPVLQLAAKFLKPERSADEKLAKELIDGLKGVYVKRYVFEKEGEFTPADVESIRSQLNGPGWTRIVNVRSKRQGNYDVVIMSEGALIKGIGVLVVEPRALMVINVVGPVDVEKLRQLEGKFGIPRLDLERIPLPSKP